MDVTVRENGVEVYLSATNLNDLAALWVASQHDMGAAYLARTLENGMVLRVLVESDTVHYKDREKGPGARTVLDEQQTAMFSDEFFSNIESENPF
jgi:hypothetical protein